MDADRREFLKAFSARKLARLVGATVFAGLDAVSEVRRATGPSLEEAGMALRDKKRRGPADVLAAPSGAGIEAAVRGPLGGESSIRSESEERTQ